jgi:hypothetical protein
MYVRGQPHRRRHPRLCQVRTQHQRQRALLHTYQVQRPPKDRRCIPLQHLRLFQRLRLQLHRPTPPPPHQLLTPPTLLLPILAMMARTAATTLRTVAFATSLRMARMTGLAVAGRATGAQPAASIDTRNCGIRVSKRTSARG